MTYILQFNIFQINYSLEIISQLNIKNIHLFFFLTTLYGYKRDYVTSSLLMDF